MSGLVLICTNNNIEAHIIAALERVKKYDNLLA